MYTEALALDWHRPDVPVKIVACSINDKFKMNISSKLMDMTCPEKIAESLSKRGTRVRIRNMTPIFFNMA